MHSAFRSGVLALARWLMLALAAVKTPLVSAAFATCLLRVGDCAAASRGCGLAGHASPSCGQGGAAAARRSVWISAATLARRRSWRRRRCLHPTGRATRRRRRRRYRIWRSMPAHSRRRRRSWTHAWQHRCHHHLHWHLQPSARAGQHGRAVVAAAAGGATRRGDEPRSPSRRRDRLYLAHWTDYL